MPIVVHLDEMMKLRGFSLGELADLVGITNVNLSRFKTGKIRAVRFDTLDPLCEALECQPGDILKFVPREDAAAPLGEEPDAAQKQGAAGPVSGAAAQACDGDRRA